jgi:hypothetical protein
MLSAGKRELDMTKASRDGMQRGKGLAQLKRFIERLGRSQGWEEADSQAALVMLAPFRIGVRNPEAVSRFTGVPLPLVVEFHRRLADNGVLPPGALAADGWLDPNDGHKLLLLDVKVATGKLRRARLGSGDELVGEMTTH